MNSIIPFTLITSFTLFLSGCGGGGGDSSPAPSGGGGNGGTNDNLTVSGVIEGINGGQVTISNSGVGKTNHSASGPFNFVISAGDSYDIVVDVNPLEQLCQVENGSGINASSNVDNVRVACVPVSQSNTCVGNTDSDGDTLSDCEELSVYYTHPWLADTDGDSFDDGREAADFNPENNRYLFNPRVADMAQIAVDLTAVPKVDLVFSQGGSVQSSVQTSYEQTEANSIRRDWGGETSRQLEVGHTLSVSNTQTVGAELSVGLTDVGATASYENSLTLGFEQSTSQTRGSSVNWSRAATTENTRAYGETLDLTEEENYLYDSGVLEVTARVRNDGHIPYDLENLTLSAVLFDPARPFDIEAIGTMTFSEGGFPATTILAGESAPLNFSTDITLGKAQRLLRESENIVVMPGTFRLLDIDNQSALLVDRDVSARTATVVVDYGVDAAREDKFRVAVNRGDGQKSISVADALNQILGLDTMEGAGQWTFGRDDTPSTTAPGLVGVNSYPMDNATNRYWLLAHNRNADEGTSERVTDYYNVLQSGYDLAAVALRAGDKLHIVYVGDRDRDGISDRMERALGTDRDLLDTDADGLDDGTEIYGWLSNLDTPPCDVGDSLTRVYADPLSADSDLDGVDDATEKERCANPSFNFIAQAGDNQFANRNMPVTLNGSVDGTPSSPPVYRWSLLSGPDVIDENGDTVRELEGRRPTFTTPDRVSTLVWELAVTIDGETQMDTSYVQVQKDRSAAVYVGLLEDGASADGSQSAPYGTLSEALNALSAGEDLYVMSLANPYHLTNTLALPDGSSMFGGYDENWVRDVYTQKTRIQLTTAIATPAISVSDVSADMWFSGFSVHADGMSGDASNDVIAFDVKAQMSGDARLFIRDNRIESSHVAAVKSLSPGSSYALRVSGLSGLRLVNNTLIAGSGGVGISGSGGDQGDKGNKASGRTGGKGGLGGNGGTGGDWGRGPAGSGGDGGDGGKVGALTGGKGGDGAGACKNASDTGNTGKTGSAGVDGRGASQPIYQNFVAAYIPSSGTAGGDGGHASGGGGGAGGGGCGFAGGGTGGGGGEGGEGGGKALGGAGAGASIGVWLNAVANSELRSNTIVASAGGNAGSGGRGGDGGSGGAGAGGAAGGVKGVCPLCDRGGAGASGGKGGTGGRGGHGGGGAAGSSFGVFVTTGVAPLLFDNTISAGDGGIGGFSWISGGNGGDSFAVFDADIGDGQLPEIDQSNVLSAGSPGVGGASVVGGQAGATGWAGETNF